MLDTSSAILRVILVFTIVLIAIRKKLSLGNAFLLGAIISGLVFGLHPRNMIQSIVTSITHPKTLSLAIIVSLILVFSHSMEMAGQMQRLLETFQGLIKSHQLNMIVFPALIGLLPMPGGAIFSAPMVKTLGSRLRLSSTQLSYINYWFRHIWEYWWPLYPGVILTVTLADLDLWVFALFLFPLTIVTFCLGYLPLKIFGAVFRQKKHNRVEQDRPPIGPFLKELIPIVITIGLGIGIGAIFSIAFRSNALFFSIAKETGLILALCVAIGWVWYQNRLSTAQRWQVLINRQLLHMVYMVVSILVFKSVLEDSHAVEAVSNELLGWHIPLMPITVLLPFLVGGVVGITIAVVGATFPILIALVESFGEGHFILGYMMLALASGFAGILLSPLHICLLLSNEYFGTTLGAIYRYLWIPCLFLLFSGIAYFWILHWLNPF